MILERHPKGLFAKELRDLRGKTPACWCAKKREALTLEDPEVCHGQVLLRLAQKGVSDQMAEDKLVIEGEMTWSEGDATHYGGLEVRIGEDGWAEVGELIAERFAISEGDRGWLDWFARESLGMLRITVERLESSAPAKDDGERMR